MEKGRQESIGGWLLLYLVWAFWGAAFSLFVNGNDLLVINRELPAMMPAAAVVFGLALVFYGCYCWLLVRLICKKPGIIRPIKTFILATPLFNALLPAVFVLVIVWSGAAAGMGRLLKEAYTPGVAGSIAGAALMAAAWFAYFCKSKRVQAIWPEG